MELIKHQNELEVHLEDKIVRLKGHKDKDAFSLFTESLETYPSLSEFEIKGIKEELQRRDDIVIR